MNHCSLYCFRLIKYIKYYIIIKIFYCLPVRLCAGAKSVLRTPTVFSRSASGTTIAHVPRSGFRDGRKRFCSYFLRFHRGDFVFSVFSVAHPHARTFPGRSRRIRFRQHIVSIDVFVRQRVTCGPHVSKTKFVVSQRYGRAEADFPTGHFTRWHIF